MEFFPSDTSIFRNLDPDQIESIQVLKDSAATRKYGENGRNGVVIITLKKQSSLARPPHSQVEFSFDTKDGLTTITADTVKLPQVKVVAYHSGN
jgi:TonB-dependent SusC/RagA subfamily outer membrane receptor